MASTHPIAVERMLSKSLKDLPPLPEAVTRILLESQKSDVSPHSLEAIIGTDQALTGKVLRVVNSAYYGLPNQVQSLGQACIILGVSQIRNLALSMAALFGVQAQTAEQRATQLRFWQHAFGAASSAQWIAKRRSLGLADEELAFVGGLLHDMGRLFLYSQMPDVYARCLELALSERIPMQEAEQKLAGLDHGTIGARMAEQWSFPENLRSLIGLHEGPFEGGENPVLYAVHIGDTLNEHIYEDDPDYVVPGCDKFAFDWFQATEFEWAEVISVTAEKVDASTRSFTAAAA